MDLNYHTFKNGKCNQAIVVGVYKNKYYYILSLFYKSNYVRHHWMVCYAKECKDFFSVESRLVNALKPLKDLRNENHDVKLSVRNFWHQ